jgi:hypothetical protein
VKISEKTVKIAEKSVKISEIGEKTVKIVEKSQKTAENREILPKRHPLIGRKCLKKTEKLYKSQTEPIHMI